jgi:N utilization substance protein A
MKSELTLAFNEITERFGLTSETVMETLEAAMVSAYRRSVNASTAQSVSATIDLEGGGVRIFAEKEVVEKVENPLTEVSIEEARKVQPDAQLGDTVVVDSTPDDFGRVAAQTAKQVILQRLREAEREAQYQEFAEREGDMVHGTVHSITPQTVTVGLGRAEAILPRNQQIPGEQFRVRDRIRVYVLEVRKSSRGPVIVVSRRHPHMLRRLLEMEVPEISQGLVEIKAIAREAGKRAKVAVAAMRDGVDPVGACVGLRGVRIQSIVRDLSDEKIDVIEWNPEPALFIAKALSPARVSGVYLDDDIDRGKTAMVVVPEDQLSLAIGRAGVNARLAARLTGWRIDIKSLPEAASESIALLQRDTALADLAEQEAETLQQVEVILAKKAENRPVTPEEYQMLAGFVDRVQKEVHGRRQEQRQARLEKMAEVRERIPRSAYALALEELELPTRTFNLLSEGGFQTVGDVKETLLIDADRILGLSGVGPKTMQAIRDAVNPVIERLREEEAQQAAVEEAEAVPAEPEEAEAAIEMPLGVEAEAVEVAPVAEEAMAEAVPEEAIAEVAPAEAAEERALEEPIPVEAEALAVEEPAAEEAVTPAEEPAIPVEAAVDEEEAFEAAALALQGVGEEEGETEDELEKIYEKSAKSKSRKKRRVVEYDPEAGELVVRRRRKRGEPDEYNNFEGG